MLFSRDGRRNVCMHSSFGLNVQRVRSPEVLSSSLILPSLVRSAIHFEHLAKQLGHWQKL